MKIRTRLFVALTGCVLPLLGVQNIASASDFTTDSVMLGISSTFIHDASGAQFGMTLQSNIISTDGINSASHLIMPNTIGTDAFNALVDAGLFSNTSPVNGPTGVGVPGDWNGDGILDGSENYDGTGGVFYYGI